VHKLLQWNLNAKNEYYLCVTLYLTLIFVFDIILVRKRVRSCFAHADTSFSRPSAATYREEKSSESKDNAKAVQQNTVKESIFQRDQKPLQYDCRNQPGYPVLPDCHSTFADDCLHIYHRKI